MEHPQTSRPKVYRAMKRGDDGLPATGDDSSSALGVRPHIDVHLDAGQLVVLDGCGMSVAPGWRDLDFTRVPKRLIQKVPGARGSNATSCYRLGNGGFIRAEVASGLELIPDDPPPSTHGVVAPTKAGPLDEYQAALWATRHSWVVDES